MPESREWGGIWKGMRNIEFGREPYMWRFYELLLGDYDFRGKRVLEMGCGTGINTILMAKRGARVTFLDFSRESLDIVRRNMEREGVEGEAVLGDMLDSDFRNEFDLVHSEGVVEHFSGPARQRVVDRHAYAAKKGGKALIIVPQVHSVAYRLGKFMAEVTRGWIHGREYPYTRFELEKRMERSGLEPGRVVGGEMFLAFGWLLSPLWLRDGTVLERSIRRPANRKVFRLNYDNWMANRWGRTIGAVGLKR
jgi:2-polyprenyl-3-methyl-5-hydroxy-6-metoxy-1,4-benzoquinol methylase